MPFVPFLDYTHCQKIFKSIDSFLCPKYGMHAIITIFHLWGFWSVRDAGSRGNKIAGIDLMLTCSVTLTFLTTLQTMLSKTDTFRTGNTIYVCLIESQLKGVKNAGNNSRCLVIIIYYFLNSEVLLNKSVCNYELRAFFSRI